MGRSWLSRLCCWAQRCCLIEQLFDPGAAGHGGAVLPAVKRGIEAFMSGGGIVGIGQRRKLFGCEPAGADGIQLLRRIAQLQQSQFQQVP